MILELDLPDLPLTAQEFERLPHVDGVRFELWEGNLIVAAAAQRAWHSEAADRIRAYFAGQGRRAIREVGVVIGTSGVPVPDVTVFHEGVEVDVERSQFPAADVACVIEVVSPESHDRDRAERPRKYARAGIPEYWIAEQAPDSHDVLVHQYRLTPAAECDQYTLIRSVSLGELEAE